MRQPARSIVSYAGCCSRSRTSERQILHLRAEVRIVTNRKLTGPNYIVLAADAAVRKDAPWSRGWCDAVQSAIIPPLDPPGTELAPSRALTPLTTYHPSRQPS